MYISVAYDVSISEKIPPKLPIRPTVLTGHQVCVPLTCPFNHLRRCASHRLSVQYIFMFSPSMGRNAFF